MTNEEVIRLVLETTGIKGLSELATQAYDTAKALDQVGEKAEEVKVKTLDLQALAGQGQSLFAAFKSGEIPEIISGVGELVGLVPGLNSFAPAIKKIGDVSGYAWPLLKNLWEQANAPVEKGLEKAAEKIVDYGTRIDGLGQTVKNFTDRTASENVELERGNKALEETTKWIEKLNGLKSTETDEAEEETKRQNTLRAAHLKKAVGGEQENIVEELALKMQAQEQAENKAAYDAMTKAGIADASTLDPEKADKLYKRGQELKKGIPKDIQDKARERVARALIGGGEEDIDSLAEGLDKKGKMRGRVLDAVDLTDEERMSPKQKKAKDAADKVLKEQNDRLEKEMRETRERDQKWALEGKIEEAQNLEKDVESARRMGNEVMTKGREQRRPPKVESGPQPQMIPPNASDREITHIIIQNQLGLDASIRADQEQLKQLKMQARQAQASINNTRTQQTTSGP
jgi:hypothetical protein